MHKYHGQIQDYHNLASQIKKMMEDKIEKALQILKSNTYEPFSTGYFVRMNQVDMGGSDFCEHCIKGAVKAARKLHKEQRAAIMEKYAIASESNTYPANELARSRRVALKEYPAIASFTYEGHDPDFGGGSTEPNTCGECGEAFETEFTADMQEAEELLRIAKDKDMSERNKWEISIALRHYEYSKEDVQSILMNVVDLLLSFDPAIFTSNGFNDKNKA